MSRSVRPPGARAVKTVDFPEPGYPQIPTRMALPTALPGGVPRSALDAGVLRVVGGVRLARAGRWKKLAGFALGVCTSLTVLGPMLSAHVTWIALLGAIFSARTLLR